jgi:hypothetical protein
MSHNLLKTGSDYGYSADVQSSWDHLGSGHTNYRLLQHSTKHPACYVQVWGFMLHPLALMCCQLPCKKIENLQNVHKIRRQRKLAFRLITIMIESLEAGSSFLQRHLINMWTICVQNMQCIRYKSRKVMTIHIVVLCNGLADEASTFQRNMVPLFSIRKTESSGSSKIQYLSTKLQDTKTQKHNALKATHPISVVLQCSLLSIHITDMHLKQQVTHPNTMWPPCSCRIIWGYPMATTYNTCCCYSPDFTLGWPSWYVTESNRVVLGQTAAATEFICVTHTDNRSVLL